MGRLINLDRFRSAHDRDYVRALEEIRRGRKTSHWMWYIFPQIRGLGYSSTSQFYAVNSLAEAKAFLSDPDLGGHLREISHALLALSTDNATAVFGRPDDMKLKSSMTLFACAAEDELVFTKVLEKFFGGRMDQKTISILNKIGE